MGNSIPLSQVRDDIATAFKQEVEWQTNEKLIPYKKMCAQKKVKSLLVLENPYKSQSLKYLKRLIFFRSFNLQVEVEIVQIESDNVVSAIVGEVANCTINKLVIGASSRSIFSRY